MNKRQLQERIQQLEAENEELRETKTKCLDKISQLITENVRLRSFVKIMAEETNKNSRNLEIIKSQALDT